VNLTVDFDSIDGWGNSLHPRAGFLEKKPLTTCEELRGGVMRIDGVDAVSARSALSRLRDEFPGVSESRIRAAIVAEWEAFTGGVPLVVPVEVMSGVREILEGASRIQIARSGQA
jgi:hypothetical protein